MLFQFIPPPKSIPVSPLSYYLWKLYSVNSCSGGQIEDSYGEESEKNVVKYEVVIFWVGGKEDLSESSEDGEDCEDGWIGYMDAETG